MLHIPCAVLEDQLASLLVTSPLPSKSLEYPFLGYVQTSEFIGRLLT